MHTGNGSGSEERNGKAPGTENAGSFPPECRLRRKRGIRKETGSRARKNRIISRGSGGKKGSVPHAREGRAIRRGGTAGSDAHIRPDRPLSRCRGKTGTGSAGTRRDALRKLSLRSRGFHATGNEIPGEDSFEEESSEDADELGSDEDSAAGSGDALDLARILGKRKSVEELISEVRDIPIVSEIVRNFGGRLVDVHEMTEDPNKS